jgi:tetratricopeptide (TPR) repeat protein
VNRTVRATLSWTAAAAVILGIASLIVSSAGERSVVVVNPLPVGVKVHFGDRRVSVAPEAQAELAVAVGGQDVVVEDQDGRVLDRHYLQVPERGPGRAVYAVLGAAPLYREKVIYVLTGSKPSESDAPINTGFTPLLGKRLQVVDADYVLTEPQKQIQSQQSSGQEVRTRVAVAPGGVKAALSLSSETEGLTATTAMARRLHRALPADPYPLGFLFMGTALEEGSDGAVALAEEGLRAAPGSAEMYRLYARAMRVAGRLAELRERYRALAAKEPRRPVATAMKVRVLPRAEAEVAARAALAEFPDDPEVLLSAAYVALRAGRPADAAALYGEVPPGPSQDADSHIRALLAASRAQEALAVALKAARAKGSGADDAALYVRVARAARRAGAKPEVEPEALVRDWAGQDGEASVAWVKALLGELLPGAADGLSLPPHYRAQLDLTIWATHDPARALELCHAGPEQLPLALPYELTNLLALEAYRVGDREVYRRLQFRVPVGEAELAAWIDRGVEPEEAWRLDDAERAAFALVRERALRAAGQPVPPALAAAARADPLRGAAYLAATTWPRPARTARPAQLVLQP